MDKEIIELLKENKDLNHRLKEALNVLKLWFEYMDCDLTQQEMILTEKTSRILENNNVKF